MGCGFCGLAVEVAGYIGLRQNMRVAEEFAVLQACGLRNAGLRAYGPLDMQRNLRKSLQVVSAGLREDMRVCERRKDLRVAGVRRNLRVCGGICGASGKFCLWGGICRLRVCARAVEFAGYGRTEESCEL